MVNLFLILSLLSSPQETPLQNGFWRLQVKADRIERLQADPTGRGRVSQIFARELLPEGWEATPQTAVSRPSAQERVCRPLNVWQARPLSLREGTGEDYAALLQPGQTFEQSFRIPPGSEFLSLRAHLPTWHTRNSGATLTLWKEGRRIAERRLQNVVDNDWVELRADTPQGAGEYRVQLSEPVGQIGWWSIRRDLYAEGSAMVNGSPIDGERHLVVDIRASVGQGSLRYRLQGRSLHILAEVQASGAPPAVTPWRWKTSWTKAGYDVSAKAGVVFKRFFSDNQRYMPAEQLKRREQAGLAFDGCGWIEMEGTRDADLRVSGSRLHLHWEMQPQEISLRFDVPQKANGDLHRSELVLTALPRRDSVPDSFPRFACSDPKLTEDLNRFYWERAFTYPAPAGPAAWFEWMAILRAWHGGPARDGEIEQLRRYPITEEGYVHTWGDMIGWPFPASPPYDTRHFDTNARFILGCWRFYLWTGDRAFLRSQAERLRRAMRYQLQTLRGAEGLIITASKDVNGRHKGVGNNYWDILPFGHLDAYANIVFYASLTAMEQIERALDIREPLADWDALRRRVRDRYRQVFWDAAKGRYIGCVDIDGRRHDYGFTFLNLEAMAYGLSDVEQAQRIYRWMETEPTSSGKPDTYARWIFAPRATTLHNPPWNPEETDGATAPDRQPPSWWHFGWTGTAFGDQCQDGGAILYTSYFDLMARTRCLGIENAWRRFMEIMGRYRLPDRLCGGPPLYRGETPQQENPGAVGVDLPFPESGLVPCFFLYGVIGAEAEPGGLRITPRLPKALTFAEVRGVEWRGYRFTIRVQRDSVRVSATTRTGKPFYRHTFPIKPGGSALIPIHALGQARR
jgi:hypothetical protein